MTKDSYRLTLAPHPRASKVARLAVERRLRGWRMPELLDDACLIVAELVANAARLGAPFQLTLSRTGERAVLIEVRDGGGGEPVVRAAGLDDEDGRGLFIVQACAADWGWRPEDGGKTIWARCGDDVEQSAVACQPSDSVGEVSDRLGETHLDQPKVDGRRSPCSHRVEPDDALPTGECPDVRSQRDRMRPTTWCPCLGQSCECRKFSKSSPSKGGLMRVKYLGSGSGEGGSPTVFATDRETLAVQGYVITDPQALSDIGEIPDGETVVEIPRELLRFAAEPLPVDPRRNRQRATSTEGQKPL